MKRKSQNIDLGRHIRAMKNAKLKMDYEKKKD